MQAIFILVIHSLISSYQTPLNYIQNREWSQFSISFTPKQTCVSATPSLSNGTPPAPSPPCLLWEEFQALADQKPFLIKNCAILNKRNNLMWQIAPLVTQQVLFFCDDFMLDRVGAFSGSLSTDLWDVDMRPSWLTKTKKLRSSITQREKACDIIFYSRRQYDTSSS